RRAELRELERVLAGMAGEIEALETALAQSTSSVERQTARVNEMRSASSTSAQQGHDLQVRLAAVERHRNDLEQQRGQWAEEVAAVATREDQSRRELAELAERVALLRDERLLLEQTRRERTDAEARDEIRLGTLREELHATQIQVATFGEKRDALQQRLDALQAAETERRRALLEACGEVERSLARSREIEMRILAATAALSEVALHFEDRSRAARDWLRRWNEATEHLARHQTDVHARRERLRALELEEHQHALDAERWRLERRTLADRIREDYELDIEQCESELSEEDRVARGEVDDEIADLRRKLAQLGAVNMDALAELQDLESRYETLSSQYRDLDEAKTTLEKIIEKINGDSRRLYAETLEAVRGNFQTLFRKVFGGGRADIVLEEDKDLLESGIEIIATPPGKHSLGLSLLSGGERALTAVTLLLALFQYRPSPFCVLDEVDGPLDEANIGRFVHVLKEFLEWTKFIVVTHSKKTMTAAHTLYGVTMQESGVSKRVSVRFEDVNEKGEITRVADEEAA
ncbi:MAG TPA: chromosome segregation protein SMC, partial [Pirellulaceae bacterium]